MADIDQDLCIWNGSNDRDVQIHTHTVAMKEHDSYIGSYTEYVTDSVMNGKD